MLRSVVSRCLCNAQSCKVWGRRAGIASAAREGRLAGKVALITGGASGLGLATAREFVRQGARVVIADLNSDLGQQSSQDLGPSAAFIRCDVTVERDVAGAVDFAVSLHGKLDILHNSAGIAGGVNPSSISDLELSEFDRVMSVNLRGTLAGIKHASRVMVPRGSGSIVSTASVCGVMGGLAPQPYSVSKFAVIGITKTAASELRKAGVRVNCVSPFIVATPMVIEEFSGWYPGAGKERIEELIGDTNEFKGVGCEEGDVANAVVYLASDEAKYVSGLNLVVDGAFTCYKHFNLPMP